MTKITKEEKIQKALEVKKNRYDRLIGTTLEDLFERAEKQGVVVDKAEFLSKMVGLKNDKAMKNDNNPEELPKGSLPDIPASERIDTSVPVIEGAEFMKEVPVFYEEFIPKNVPKYVEKSNEFEIANRLMEQTFNGTNPVNVLCYGPAGNGKTLFWANVAQKRQMSLVQVDMSDDLRRSALIGGPKLINNETVWKHGGIGEAIECANQNPNGAMYVSEEGNQPRGEIQKLQNGLLDYRRAIYVPELGRYVRLRKGAKLFIVLTMNPAGDGYSGNEIEKSVDDRFGFQWEWTYPTIEECKKILGDKLKDIPKEFSNKVFKLVLEVQNLVNEKKLSQAISPRQQASIFSVFKAFEGMEGAEKMVLEGAILRQSMDEDERDLIKSRMESIFSDTAVSDNVQDEDSV
jgi:MoxR-like ATPase